jgi:hypothetical protein
MIRYRLQCDQGHAFDGWFRNADAFERQAKRKLVHCPDCGSAAVAKALMAPSVVASAAKRRGQTVAAEPKDGRQAQQVTNASQREILQMMRKLRDEVMARSEYVGPRFAEEARKIHLDESERRGIYGEATAGEVKELTEEGIEIYPLPVLPEDHN